MMTSPIYQALSMCFTCLSYWILTLLHCEVDMIIISLLQKGKLSLRENKSVAQSHTVGIWTQFYLTLCSYHHDRLDILRISSLNTSGSKLLGLESWYLMVSSPSYSCLSELLKQVEIIMIILYTLFHWMPILIYAVYIISLSSQMRKQKRR